MTQIKTWHFALLFAATLITGALGFGLIPATGQWHQLALLVQWTFAAFGVKAAAAWPPPDAATTDPSAKYPTPPSLPPVALLVFLGLGLALSGCAGAKVWGKCELNQLPQTAQSLIALVTAVAANPASFVEDLTKLEDQLGPQVACVAAALLADQVTAKSYPVMGAHLNGYLKARMVAGKTLSCR